MRTTSEWTTCSDDQWNQAKRDHSSSLSRDYHRRKVSRNNLYPFRAPGLSACKPAGGLQDGQNELFVYVLTRQSEPKCTRFGNVGYVNQWRLCAVDVTGRPDGDVNSDYFGEIDHNLIGPDCDFSNAFNYVWQQRVCCGAINGWRQPLIGKWGDKKIDPWKNSAIEWAKTPKWIGKRLVPEGRPRPKND